jgi:putative intracellular protease/amidase
MHIPLLADREPLPAPRRGPLVGTRALAIVAPTDTSVEDVRALHDALFDAGVALSVASETHGKAYDVHRDSVDPDLLLIEVAPERYGALVLVGGPGAARVAADPLARDVVRAFAAAGKPIVAIAEGADVTRAAQADDAAIVDDGVEAAILVRATLSRRAAG